MDGLFSVGVGCVSILSLSTRALVSVDNFNSFSNNLFTSRNAFFVAMKINLLFVQIKHTSCCQYKFRHCVTIVIISESTDHMVRSSCPFNG